MVYTTLIDPATLAGRLTDPTFAIIDCRFTLDDPAWGEGQYRTSHIPGAMYAHLSRDLAGAKTGTNGRHPLPDPDALARRLGRLGIGAGVQVVAYDQDTGMYASRLWWLLRWLGHPAVAVLDGGFAAWMAEQRPISAATETAVERTFAAAADPTQVAHVEMVAQVATDPARGRLLDARAPERFRGEVEPIDKAAGHIPGAVNHFFKTNLDPAGRFLTSEALRAGFADALAGTTPAQAIAYCGSGVTACHNLLALEHAGLSGARLYPGSWSEWSSDPGRPIATGERVDHDR